MNMQQSPFRAMQSLYNNLLWIQVGFGIASLVLVLTGLVKPLASIQLDRLLQVIAVLVSFAAVIIGIQVFRRRLEAVLAANPGPVEKVAQYRSAATFQWTLLTIAVVVSIIGYLLTANWSFLALALTLLVVYGGLNPFKSKVRLQLRLSDSDMAQLGG
ncbi:hypothetical protein KJS94_12810 [Flavihumibacter rivuli]|uniref:hypothetical protein n=1 Tax=Flavihumibacter rivuli TaxID=2838156 RepID=UPI001BDE1EB3|nr:hypothetical protein [Flavihumibacter rivuli]ULQ55525.1 hypothetical protein KJS94_12810 [Flavihumibacter rivuli]